MFSMSWPIGFGKPDHRYTSTLDGTVHVDGVPVTEPNGWIVVQAPAQMHGQGALDTVALRVRLSVDREGHPFLYAEQVEVGSVRFNGVHAWVQNGGAAWLPWLAGCVHEAMVRRLDARSGSGGAQHEPPMAQGARSTFVVERPSLSADETWRGQKAIGCDETTDPMAPGLRSPRPRRRRRSTGDASP